MPNGQLGLREIGASGVRLEKQSPRAGRVYAQAAAAGGDSCSPGRHSTCTSPNTHLTLEGGVGAQTEASGVHFYVQMKTMLFKTRESVLRRPELNLRVLRGHARGLTLQERGRGTGPPGDQRTVLSASKSVLSPGPAPEGAARG